MQTTSDPRLVEPDKQHWLAMHREMINYQTGHRTVYAFDHFELSTSLTDKLFNARTLEDE